ncbi:MAG: radical SAM protein [Bdellovibrionota bacterium]|nr:radical SAM protein [Bdellovibrionota bacterium]
MKDSKRKASTVQLEGNKLLHHLDKVESWKNGEIINPIYVAFSPSSLCNHKCTFCVYHYKKFEPIFFPLDRYRQLIEEFSTLGVRSLFFAGDGDPLLNKHCVEMIELTREHGIDVAMNTNGYLMKDGDHARLARDLDWIRFSVNGGDRSTYASIHQTSEKDFDRVIANIQKLVCAKKEVGSEIVIGVQCVLLNENKDSIAALAYKLKDIGVDYLAVKPFLKHPKTEWTCELENKSKVLSELTKLHKLNDGNFSFHLREANFGNFAERGYKRCLSGRFMIEIDARGDIYSCGPYIGDSNHNYGNILKTPFSEVWQSDACREKIQAIQDNLDVSKCMPNCRPNSVNETLWQLKNPPKHINFI